MGELGLLTCPVCGKQMLVAGADADRDSLKADARAHLADHDLAESERGIYGVMMAERLSAVDVRPADGVEPGEWVSGATVGPDA